jgi:hypothetical protein
MQSQEVYGLFETMGDEETKPVIKDTVTQEQIDDLYNWLLSN